MQQPIEEHFQAVKRILLFFVFCFDKTIKRILRYIKGTLGYRLPHTIGLLPYKYFFFDADWAKDCINKRSTSGCYISILNIILLYG